MQQATLPPAFPVFRLSSCPPNPRSSDPTKFYNFIHFFKFVLPSWMTIALPLIVWGLPITAKSSWTSTIVLPELLVFMFPRSPMCLLCASGAPWVLLKGLKCPPAALQPSLRSPNWWTWNPWLPGVSPSIIPEKLYFMLYFTGVTNNTLTECFLASTWSQCDL